MVFRFGYCLTQSISKMKYVLSSFFIQRQIKVYWGFIREKEKMNWRLFEDTIQNAFCCLFKDKSKSNLAFLFIFEERKREDNIL